MSKNGMLISVASDQEGKTPRIVTEDEPFPIALFDGAGNPLSSYYHAATDKYSLDIHDAHVHNQIVNRYFHQHTATETTLAADSAVNAYQISIADATGFAVDDYLHINTTTPETTHPRLISSVPALPTAGPAVFTLDRRMDTAHLTGDTLTKAIIDMALTGQVGTMTDPQEYAVWPDPGQVWHITRILFSMVHETAGDLGLFGNIAALLNGMLIRAKINGQYGTLTNWKVNADMKTDMFDVEFDARSGGQGNYGTSGRGTFTETGAVVRLDGDQEDRLEIYIQDDITALGFFGMKAQGHVEGI